MKLTLLFALAFVAVAAAQSCTVDVTQTLGSQWVSNGQAYSQWNVAINNKGTQTALYVKLNIGDANIDQIYTIEKVSAGVYQTPSYVSQNGGVTASNPFQFGYIVKQSTQVSITVASVSCNAAASASAAPSTVVASPQPSSPAASTSPAAPSPAAPSPAASSPAAPSSAPAACSAKVVAVARSAASGGSWTDGSFNYQIVDITATNNGAQPITNIALNVVLGAGNSVSQMWELAVNNGAYSIPTPYGPIQVGASQGGGFIIKAALNVAISFSVTGGQVTCTGGSSQPSAAPSSVVSSPQPSTPAASASPAAPSPAPAGCSLKVTITPRTGANSQFNDANGFNQVFDLTFSNTGSKAVTAAQLKFALDTNVYVSQFYELARIDATTFALTAPSQYGPIQAGASAMGVLIGANKQTGTTSIATPGVSVSFLQCQN